MVTKSLTYYLKQASLSQAEEKEFCRCLLAADLYILGEIADVDVNNEETQLQIDENVDVQITHWEDPSGKDFIPVFTTLEQLAEAVEESETYLCLNGSDLLAMTEGETLFINPDSDEGKVLSAEDIKRMLK